MTDTPQITQAEAIEARAADFLHRRRVARWSDADEAALDAWLCELTLHRVAWLRLEESEARLEASIDRIADIRAGDLDRLRIKRRRSFAVPLLALAASLGAIAVLGVAAETYIRSQPTDRTYSTDVGGRTLLKFADRTLIELNTDTLIRFRMTGEERTVWLERGEAWFHVSHDASRPFNVIVGRHRVTDLGTEFLVRRGSDEIDVALLKGRASLSTEGAQTAMLAPGDEAIATPASMSVTRKTPQQLGDELAWQRGTLVFRNTRLADAVREFNRYNAARLVIADPSIAGMRVSVEINNDNFQGFLQLAQTVLNLRVDREGNDYLISRAQRKSKRAQAAP